MDKSVFPNLAIIIVNLDQKEVTKECVDSLLTAGIALSQIMIVDNGSSDGSLQFFSGTYGPALHLVPQDRNLGYAHALNAGINASPVSEKTWFLLMNNDTVVAENFFDEIKSAVDNNPDKLLFSPMILYYNQPEVIWFLGNKRIPGTLITYDPYHNKPGDKYSAPINIDFLHGCAMIINGAVFKKIGLFNDWSLIYSEEVDFCWRAKLAGFKMASIPKARMWHKVSAYMGQHKPRTRYLRIRNQSAFYRRYTSGLLRGGMWLFSFVRILVLMVKDIFRRQTSLIKPMLAGWSDGWSGRTEARY